MHEEHTNFESCLNFYKLIFLLFFFPSLYYTDINEIGVGIWEVWAQSFGYFAGCALTALTRPSPVLFL